MSKMDKKQIQRQLIIALACLLAFIIGVFWQRYYTVHRLLMDLGIRTVEYSDSRDRVEYPITDLKKPLIILIFGQSNVANTVSQKSQTNLPILNFYQGKLYRAKDPLLGATGQRGSLWISTAKKLLDISDYKEIILINTARSNSSVKDWLPQGKFYDTLKSSYHALNNLNLPPQVIVFGQGERDAIDGVSYKDYNRNLHILYKNIQHFHENKPFLLSLTSRCFEYLPNNNIRKGQIELIREYPSVFQGPDTDKFNEVYRYDGCHYNTLGKIKISKIWANKIIYSIRSNTQTLNNGTM